MIIFFLRGALIQLKFCFSSEQQHLLCITFNCRFHLVMEKPMNMSNFSSQENQNKALTWQTCLVFIELIFLWLSEAGNTSLVFQSHLALFMWHHVTYFILKALSGFAMSRFKIRSVGLFCSIDLCFYILASFMKKELLPHPLLFENVQAKTYFIES